MHENEIQLFSSGLQFAKNEFYLDAVNELKILIEKYSDSDLVDDAIYNIGLCYFHLNQFETAIEYFQKVIHQYPDSTITVLEGGNEYGRTTAKCHYATLNCFIALGRVDLAYDILKALDDYPDSYLINQLGEKITYKEIAKKALKIYEST